MFSNINLPILPTPIIMKHYVPEFVVGCMIELYDKIVVVAGSFVILVEMPLKVF